MPEVSACLVLPPLQNAKDAATMEQVLSTLAASPAPIAFEIACDHQERKLIIRAEADVLRRAAQELCESYEVETETLEARADPAAAFRSNAEASPSPRVSLAARLSPERPEFLPLKIWREFEAQEPLCALLGAFSDLAPGEVALSQVILRGGAPGQWSEPHLQQLAAHQRHGYGAGTSVPGRKILSLMAGAACGAAIAAAVAWALLDYWPRLLVAAPICLGLGYLAVRLRRLGRDPWVTTLDDDVVEKLHDDAILVDLRLFATAATEARARALLQQLVGVYGMFNTVSGNRLAAETLPAGAVPFDLAAVGRRQGVVLSVREIAGLWHIPVLEALKLVKRQTYERILPRPEDVGASAPGRAFAPVGVSRKGSVVVPVSLAPAALNSNLLLVGRTQMGKTTLMERLAHDLARDTDRALLFIDPHGDAAQRLIGLLPAERASDVFYVNLADDARAVGLNLLDVHDVGGADPDAVAENFVDVAKALWEDYWGPRMIVPLLNGLKALTYANLRRPPERQFTILALPTLLTCEREARQAFLSREVPYGLAPAIHRYFQGEFEDSSPSFREQVLSPVLSKARAFERSPLIQRLVGQPRSTLSLVEAVRQHKIMVINTNAGLLGNDLAGFLGSLLVNVLHKVILQQAERLRDQRARVTVIADEFQKMAGVDWGAATGELQKFGGNFILGTQALGNLLKDEKSSARVESLFAGVLTTFAFRTNGADAYYLTKHELDAERVRAESLMNQPRGHAYVKTVNAEGLPIPVFALEAAPPLEVDPAVVQSVLAGRAAYAVPAAEADRLVRISLAMLDEYGTYAQHTPDFLAAEAIYAATQAPGDRAGSETLEAAGPAQLTLDLSHLQVEPKLRVDGEPRLRPAGARPIILHPSPDKAAPPSGGANADDAGAAATSASRGVNPARDAQVSPETGLPITDAADTGKAGDPDRTPAPRARSRSGKALVKKKPSPAADTPPLPLTPAEADGRSPSTAAGPAQEFATVVRRGLATGPAREDEQHDEEASSISRH